MTIKFAAHIAFDTFIFICFWSIFKGGSYAEYAENIVLFWFWIQAFIGICWMFITDPETLRVAHEKIKRAKMHFGYGVITFIIEVTILVALGHPVLAFFYILGGGNMMLEVQKASKL